MAWVGERLRLERESRNTSLADLSLASGIGESYLDALERGEIEALPGPAFGKLYIRAYAEVLGFDPQPWIDDYDRERRRMSAPDNAAPVPSAAEPRRVAAAIASWRESRATATAAPVAAPAAQALEERVEEVVANPDSDPEPDPEPDPKPPPPTPPPEPEPEPAPHPEPRRDPDPERPPMKVAPRRLAVAAIALAVLVFVSWMIFGRSGRSEPVPAASTAPAASPPSQPVEAPAAVLPPPIASAKPQAPPRAREADTARPAPGGTLAVAESGIGRRVVDGRLEGQDTEFAEGEAVVFQTRVRGGGHGDAIRHVWMFNGRAQQSISLRVGGPDYRTHSRKTLFKRGPWTVEARDGAGRVLASAAFTCNARGSR